MWFKLILWLFVWINSGTVVAVNGVLQTRKDVCSSLTALLAKAGGINTYKSIIENRLCKAAISNLTLVEVATQLNTYQTAEVQAFLDELNIACTTPELCNPAYAKYLSAEVIRTWYYLYSKHPDKTNQAKFARKDWNTLQQFSKLSDVVKEYIVKFSDTKADDSSLKKFCADLAIPLGGGSNVPFIDYVNNVDNLNVVKNFVGHKLNDTPFDPDYEQISEAEADNSLVGLAQDWVKRSAAWRKTQGYMQDGRDYGDHAAKNLLSPNSSLATSLGIDMSDYYLFREVYLYVDKAQDQYTKADILLVKYRPDGITVENVILLETKISGSTEYTPRQKQSYRIIENGVGKVGVFELKSNKTNSILNNAGNFEDGNKTLDKGITAFLSIDKSKAFKISDTGLKNGPLNKSNIDTGRYIDYIAPDNK